MTSPDCREAAAHATRLEASFYCSVHGSHALTFISQARLDALAEHLAAAQITLAQIVAAPDSDTMRRLATQALASFAQDKPSEPSPHDAYERQPAAAQQKEQQ